MTHTLSLLLAASLLLSFEAQATFKAGQIYKLKRTLTLTPKTEKATMEGPSPADSAAFEMFWSLDKKKVVKAEKAAPGLCELIVVQKAVAGKEVKIRKGAIYKFSTPMTADDASADASTGAASTNAAKNCLVMDALSEEHGAAEKPQIQFTCCSEKDLPTPASHQDFNELMQERLKPLLKLISEN